MVTANITNHSSVHTGTFSINIAFDAEVSGFSKSDMTFRAVSGNGITGLMFSEITGDGANYMVTVRVPDDVAGAFSVEIDGQVNASGIAQDVTMTPRTFSYDTVQNVTTTMKEVQHRDNGEIVLRVVFSVDVLWFDKTDLRIHRLAGNDPTLMDYYITGQGRDYSVVFVPAPETQGAIEVNIDGFVQRTTGTTREIVNITPVVIVYP